MQPNELFSLAGKHCFVTGAASGLGLAMSEIMAECGATVTMADIDQEGLSREAERLRKLGRSVTTVQVDVTDEIALEAAIDTSTTRVGRLDVCVPNAGGSVGPGGAARGTSIENYPLEAWHRTLKLTLTSAFVTLRCAARHMKAQRRGRVIIVSSGAGLRARPLVGYGYVASKSGLINMVRQAAVELAPYGITVNAIAPGPIKTNIGAGMLDDPEKAKPFIDMIPMKRLGSPEEIKGLALLLASDASSFITGTIIPVDGGATA
jgi:NAD(P)-dependent dehydrogenase (short-subunit alcohol dehydrogenase family)